MRILRKRSYTALGVPALLLAIIAGFYWKLVLTDQFDWIWGPDLAQQVLPWFQFQAREWHAGRFPLWDPHLWLGQSLIGQAQPGAAYPLNWILFLLPLENGLIRMMYLQWYYIAIHLMAALFCYWLCRDLGRSRPASILGGLIFSLAGYIGTTDWPQMINGAVWAPLVLLFLLRAARGVRPLASAALSGMFLGIAWLSGHHQIPIYTSLTAAGLWLFYTFRAGRPDWRMLRLAAVAAVFAALTGAMQILPAYEYGHLARRWAGGPEPLAWNQPVPYTVHKEYSLYPWSLFGIVFPGLNRHADPFVGVVALSLALLGVAVRWTEHSVRMLTAIAIGGLLYSLGFNNVFHGMIYALVPLAEKARVPSMAVLIFHLGVAALAAFGVDSCSSIEISPWPRRAMLGVALFGLIAWTVLLAVLMAYKLSPASDDRVVLPGLFALLLAALLYGWQRGNLSRRQALILTGALLLVELGNVSGFTFPHRLEKSRTIFLDRMRANRDIAEFLRSLNRPVRLAVNTEEMIPNFGDWNGIDVLQGNLASVTSNVLEYEFTKPRTLMFLGVNYTVAREPSGPEQKPVFEAESGLKVFENPGAFPRAWAVHEAVQIHQPWELRSLILDPGFDLRRKTFLYTPPPGLESCEGTDEVRLAGRESDRLVIEANLSCRGMVVLSETFFPGWVARVDSRPVPIYEAYGALRGVVVEGGRHVIEMRYRPKSFYWGAALSAVGLLGACLLAWRAT